MDDSILYIVTLVMTVWWAVSMYNLWESAAKLREDSIFRFLLIIGPATWFVVIAAAGWEVAEYIRLDVIGLVAFNALIVIIGGLLFILRRVFSQHTQRIYVISVIVFNVLALLIALFAHLIKFFPPLLIGLTSYVTKLQNVDVLSLSWLAINPENHDESLIGVLNKIFIALFTYLPITVFRFVYNAHQRKKMNNEIQELRERVEELEGQLEDKGTVEGDRL